MKLDTVKKDVVRSGVVAENTASIEMNAQMFEMLSSRIYTDPILAVVRELSCNAYDSHVDAGRKDVPFEIHLPNKLEPWFSVRDYGVGLTDEDVRNLYMTYGRSTKRNSNDVIGAFGIGSKSPFAYGDSFQAISVHGGQRCHYNVFKNEDNIPAIALMHKEATDEHNGFEVRVTVRDYDFSTFADKVATALRFFETKPKVVGAVGFHFDKTDATLVAEGPNFTVSETSNSWSRGEFVAVQGNVPYIVDIDQVESHLNAGAAYLLRKFNMVGFFKIGDLEVAGNREEVQYNDRTIKNLVDMINEAHTVYLKDVDSELSGITGNDWTVFSTLRTKFASCEALENISAGYKFKSKVANRYISDNGHLTVPRTPLHDVKVATYARGGRAKKTSIIGTDDNGNMLIRPSKYSFVMVADIRQRHAVRLNAWIEDKASELNVSNTTIKVFLLIPEDLKMVNSPAFNKEQDKIIKSMGNPELLVLSEDTDDVVVTRTGTSKGTRSNKMTFKTLIFNPDTRRSTRNIRPTLEEETEPTHDALFMTVDLVSRCPIIDGDVKSWTHHDMEKFIRSMVCTINIANGTSYKTSDVYLLTKKVAKHAATMSNMTNIFDLFKTSLDSIKRFAEVFDRFAATTDVFGLKDELQKKGRELLDNVDPNGHFFSTVDGMVSDFEEYNTHYKRSSSLLTDSILLAKSLGETMFDKQNNTPYFKKRDIARYEMLGLSRYGFDLNDSTIKIIATYIDTVDVAN